MLSCSHCGCSCWRSFQHSMYVSAVLFKTWDNSNMGTWSPRKQNPYFHRSWSYLFVFNFLVCIQWKAVWECFFWLKEPWMSTASPASGGEHFRGADGSSSSWPQCKQELEKGWVTIFLPLFLCWTEHLLPRLVNLINLLVLIWDEEWQSGGLVLYQCPFVEFHLRIFKYVCPVQVCCPGSAWAVMRWMLLESKGLISSAVSMLS